MYNIRDCAFYLSSRESKAWQIKPAGHLHSDMFGIVATQLETGNDDNQLRMNIGDRLEFNQCISGLSYKDSNLSLAHQFIVWICWP